MPVNCRTDDGSDKFIVSPKFSERSVLNGIVKMTKINKLTLQVALNSTSEAQCITFSRTWTPPRTVLQLFTGPLALVSAKFLVADDELAE